MELRTIRKSVEFEEVHKSPVVWLVTKDEFTDVYLRYQNALDSYHLMIEMLLEKGCNNLGETKFDEGSYVTLLSDVSGHGRKVSLECRHILDFFQ